MKEIYYVYEYFCIETGNVFHVGAGSRNRLFSQSQRSKEFHRMVALQETSVRIYRKDLTREEAIEIETARIKELKSIGQAETNKNLKGTIPIPSEETKIKLSYSAQKRKLTEKEREIQSRSAYSRKDSVNKKIGETLKGRNTHAEYWLVTLFNGNELTFKTAKEIGEYFGVSRSLVNNWKYGRISARHRRRIIKVEIMKEEGCLDETV